MIQPNSYGSDIVKGLAELLATAGFGFYSETAAIPKGQTPITLEFMPADPDAVFTLNTYLPERERMLGGGQQLATTRVQIRWRMPPGQLGQDTFHALEALIDRKSLTLRGQPVHGAYLSFSSLGQDGNRRLSFTSNWSFTGLQLR